MLAEAWRTSPDLRLGQLVHAVAEYNDEDDVIVDRLLAFLPPAIRLQLLLGPR